MPQLPPPPPDTIKEYFTRLGLNNNMNKNEFFFYTIEEKYKLKRYTKVL